MFMYTYTFIYICSQTTDCGVFIVKKSLQMLKLCADVPVTAHSMWKPKKQQIRQERYYKIHEHMTC